MIAIPNRASTLRTLDSLDVPLIEIRKFCVQCLQGGFWPMTHSLAAFAWHIKAANGHAVAPPWEKDAKNVVKFAK